MYARNTINTTLPWFRGAFDAILPGRQSHLFTHPGPIRPTLTSFADEVLATVARLFAYVGVLALFGIPSIRAWDQLQVELTAEPASEQPGALPTGALRAFALFIDRMRRINSKKSMTLSFGIRWAAARDVLH